MTDFDCLYIFVQRMKGKPLTLANLEAYGSDIVKQLQFNGNSLADSIALMRSALEVNR